MGTKPILKQSDMAFRFCHLSFNDRLFGKRIPLFHWKGLTYRADSTQLLIFVALVLSLRFRLFPFFYASMSTAEYWGMAAFTGLGIVVSVIAQEMIHVTAARRMGEHPYGLFLQIVGSEFSAESTQAPRAKRAVLYLSGIVFGTLLSAGLVGLAFVWETYGRNDFVVRILFHLGAFNLTLALLHCLPVLPLDGGRFFLNALSRDGGPKLWVVRAFYAIGVLIGMACIIAGGYQMHEQRPVLGAWIAALGLLLLSANYDEYKFLTIKCRIAGRPIQSLAEEKR